MAGSTSKSTAVDKTTRTLNYQGPTNDGATIQFVEHHTFDDGSEDGSVQGITMVQLSKDQWVKLGAPFDLTVEISGSKDA